jgi:SAM-dependent methyltransferase
MSIATRGVEISTTPYDRAFFQDRLAGARRSAREVVPIVFDLLRPESVVDVGCGLGAWLVAFKELGVGKVLGLDGAYVNRDVLLLPDAEFKAAELSQPFGSCGRFDLALCLEVAEHLPAAAAKPLVSSLTGLAPAVLFSAAPPRQGGIDHVNEQWPRYWRGLFAEHGYSMLDYIRPLILRNSRVEWWYRQNTFLFVDRNMMASHQGEFQPYLAEDDDDWIILREQVFTANVAPPTSIRTLSGLLIDQIMLRITSRVPALTNLVRPLIGKDR